MTAIYAFGKDIDTGMFDNEVVGGKGAKLAEMGANGFNVPPGVTIPVEVCGEYLNSVSSKAQNELVSDTVNSVLTEYEAIAEKFGYMPLVSVRSGARVSMPGMMDTILNVGINDENFDEWSERLGQEAAHDCYRRLIEMYGEVVKGINPELFGDTVSDNLEAYETVTGQYFPQDLEEQLEGAILAVFHSWYSDRANAYRKLHHYSDDWFTAVNVQAMVFGNRNNQSCSGVMFTRDFNTGAPETIIDWLPNAQGEDVVAGTHTPNSKVDLIHWNQKVYDELGGVAAKLEAYYRDMQDIEFTVDDGELFILQTRDGKRAAAAAFKIAYDMHMSGTINAEEAVGRVSGKQYLTLLKPRIDPACTIEPTVTGLGTSGNIVTGVAVFSAAEAIKSKEPCILFSKETTPKDFAGMVASVGIVTSTGGQTSHAAVVARGMNKTCIVGAEFFGRILEGQQVTIDGSTGTIWVDTDIPVLAGEIAEHVQEVVSWATPEVEGMFEVAPDVAAETDGTEEVYVDVSKDIGAAKILRSALDCVKASDATGVIGFGLTQTIAECDQEFLNYFGCSTRCYSDEVNGIIVEVLASKLWTKKMKADWTLHLAQETPVSVKKLLMKQGWNVVTRVYGLASALDVDGLVEIDARYEIELEEQGLSFEALRVVLVEAGREVRQLPERVSRNRVIFDSLGG